MHIQADRPDEAYAVTAPDYPYFHPKQSADLEERYHVKSVYFQYYDPEKDRWMNGSQHTPAIHLHGSRHLHCREPGLMNPQMPQGQPTTTGPFFRSSGSSIPSQPSPASGSAWVVAPPAPPPPPSIPIKRSASPGLLLPLPKKKSTRTGVWHGGSCDKSCDGTDGREARGNDPKVQSDVIVISSDDEEPALKTEHSQAQGLHGSNISKSKSGSKSTKSARGYVFVVQDITILTSEG